MTALENIEHPMAGTRPVALTVTEAAALLECEAKIRHGLRAFVAMGHALARIRDSRLYRGEFSTFEEYCPARWGMSGRRARQICAAAEVVQRLESTVSSPESAVLPETESQARPLTELPREEQVPAWEEVLATAPEGRVTANHVANVVQRRLERLKPAAIVQSPQFTVKSIDAGTRQERIAAVASRAQADLRELQDLIGTADGAVTANVAMAVGHIDALRDHLSRVEKLHANRNFEQKETEATKL